MEWEDIWCIQCENAKTRLIGGDLYFEYCTVEGCQDRGGERPSEYTGL